MTAWLARRLLVLLLPVALSSCLFTPGKFTSTLSINADRSFAFTYVGEVISADPSGAMAQGLANMGDKATPGETHSPSPAEAAKAKADADTKNRQIAETLSKEAGYRKVAYIGDGVFTVDYAIRGTLDHAFVYPFNLDAEAIIPFIALELRQGGMVRVKAPAFAKSDDKNPMGGMGGGAASKLDGVFTLDTDGEIVSQNNEDGVKTVGGRKTITWHATPLTTDAPTAVVRFAAPRQDTH